MKTKIKNLITNGLSTIHKYPLVLLSAFTSAIFLILFTENETEHILARISLTASLGISLFFALQTTFEKHKYQLGAYLLGGVLLVFHYFFILPKDFDNPLVDEIITNIAWFFASHLLVSFLPLIFKKIEEKYFWEYNKNLFINIFLSKVFIGVFIIGIVLALLAISNLFDINIKDKIFINFTLFSLIFGSCFIFLSFISNDRIDNKTTEYPVVLKFFTQFILIPLLIIYGGILYLYGGKILLTWELPKGWISFMIMAYSSVGIFAFLLVYPLSKSGAKSWVQFFSKIFHYSILPLLVLLFVAIFTRVLEYGFTENRYFVLLYAIWISFISFYFIFWKNAHIKIIPISLFIFTIFSIYTPFLNNFEISKYSQKKNLEKILKEHQLLKNNGKINFTQEIPYDVASDIAQKMLFLKQRQEEQYLLNLIDKEQHKDFETLFKDRYLYYDEFINLFKISKGKETAYLSNAFFLKKPSGTIALHEKYDYYLELNTNNSVVIHPQLAISYDLAKITLDADHKKYEYIFEKELKEYLKENAHNENPSPVPFQLGNYEGLLIAELNYKRNGQQSPFNILGSFDIIIFLKEKKKVSEDKK